MKASTLLLITLTCQGHWFAEQPAQVMVQWRAAAQHPDAVLTWTLAHGETVLSEGRLRLADEQQPARLTITPPAVRATVDLTWHYRLYERAEGQRLVSGQLPVRVYPDRMLEGLAGRFKSQRLMVWTDEHDDALPALLESAGVAHQHINEIAGLRFTSPSIALVTSDHVDRDGYTALEALAQQGTSVMLFERPASGKIGGYELVRRPVPDQLTWREAHPLLRSCDSFIRASWLAEIAGHDESAELRAVRFPSAAPALAIAHWPLANETDGPVPVDAAVMTTTVGDGRLVCWQLPIGSWQRDPRAQRLLVSALDFLASPPVPTPPRSQRRDNKPDAAVPTIHVPGGDAP